RRQFVEETAGRAGFDAAITSTLLAVAEQQRLPGAGETDIEQSSFLLDAAFVDGGGMREGAFFQTDQRDMAELQALGGVQCHQAHAVTVVVVAVAEQADQLRQLGQAAASLPRETGEDVLQRIDVAMPALALVDGLVERIQILGIADAVEDVAEQLVGCTVRGATAPV